jgi:hypothetical protein
MNRSTLRSISTVVATAVIALSFSPLAASAQTLSATDGAGKWDIVYGDGDEGAIYVGPITVTAHPAAVVLAPGDALFGDQDQGVIAEGPAPVYATSLSEANPPAALDMLFIGDDEGGTPVDLSAFRGRSNITMAELTGGPASAASAVDAYQFGNDGCD